MTVYIVYILYYAELWDDIAAMVKHLPTDSTVCVLSAKTLFKNPTLKEDLVYIKANFSFLPSTIVKLEGKEHVSVVQEGEVKIKGEDGVKAKCSNEKKKNRICCNGS